MRIPDLTNGLFELLGSMLIWRNAWQLWKDKEIKGVYWPVTIFMAGWGLWNLYYYPSLEQWFSFWGGVSMVTGNLFWTAQAIYYMTRRQLVEVAPATYAPAPNAKEPCPHTTFDDQLICTGCGGCALDLQRGSRE